MKRITSVLLVVVMLLGAVLLAACNDGGEVSDTSGAVSDVSGVVSGEVSGTDEVANVYAGDPEKDYRDEKFYTYLDYIGGTSGMNWNPHQWETNDDSYVLGYITTALYDFVLNADLSGYTIIPEAAAALPEDVTAEYVGQYGIVEGDEAKAWKIALNPDVTWDDGTKINAETYVYSMKQLLDPVAINRRADSFYAGDFEIVNAKNYFYDGKTTYNATGSSLAAELEAGTALYMDMWNAWGLEGCVDADGNACPQYVLITDETKYRDASVAEGEDGDWISAKEIYESTFAPGTDYESVAGQYIFKAETPKIVTWEEVGIKALDEYTILMVTANPVAEAEFYMPYNLSSPWLVKKDLYESCQTWYDADGNEVEAGAENAVSIINTYGTDVEKTAGYGPYNLTYFELDKQITFERNNNWYGYKDDKHFGQYQTDKISCQVIVEHKTALQAFLKGEIDGIGLDATDMETYGSSDRILYTPESYTTKLTFNTNKEKLEEIGNGAVILTVPEFREAFSLAIDREKYCTELTASHEPGYGLLNYMYCYDPFTGELYRDSEYAQEALVRLYGIEYGEGKDYGSLEEAYEAITGYDPAKATELMKTAAQKAIDEKIWDGESKISLELLVYSSDDAYVKLFNFYNDALKAVAKGTAFDGKLELVMKEDPDYYETMYSGNATIITSTWGGAAMSPFTMLYQCYCDSAEGAGNQMEYGYDTANVMVEITVGDKTIEASLQNWALWANGNAVEALDKELGKFADYTYAERCEIFAELEYTYLDSFVTIPVYYRNSASILSNKLDYATTDYLQIVGYGGLRYATYNYDDTEWDAVKADQKYE